MHHGFSKRKKIAQAGALLYDELPHLLRDQLAGIFLEAIGPYEDRPFASAAHWWDQIADEMQAENLSFRTRLYPSPRPSSDAHCATLSATRRSHLGNPGLIVAPRRSNAKPEGRK